MVLLLYFNHYYFAFQYKSLHRQIFLHTRYIYYSYYNIINLERFLLQKSNDKHFATFFTSDDGKFVGYSLLSCEIFPHAGYIYYIHIREYTMTEIRNEGNPKFLSTTKAFPTANGKLHLIIHVRNRRLYVIIILQANFLRLK